MPSRTIQLPVTGMTCQACAQAVERALAAVPGVERAEVNFGSRTATIERDPELATGASLAAAIEGIGYGVPPDADSEVRSLAEDVSFADEAARRELARTRRDFFLALGFGLAAVVLARLGSPPLWPILVSAPALFWGGAGVLASGWKAARRLAPDMNTLVGMGCLAAWTAAALGPAWPAVFGSWHAHLHAVVMILAFVLLGRWLEGRARNAAGGAVRALLDLAPPRRACCAWGRSSPSPWPRCGRATW